jgi:hypothetical protein
VVYIQFAAKKIASLYSRAQTVLVNTACGVSCTAGGRVFFFLLSSLDFYIFSSSSPASFISLSSASSVFILLSCHLKSCFVGPSSECNVAWAPP